MDVKVTQMIAELKMVRKAVKSGIKFLFIRITEKSPGGS